MENTSLIFDTKTLASWKDAGISVVMLSFVSKGCEGTKLFVETATISPETIEEYESRILASHDITIAAPKKDWEKLENARITNVNGKWIFTSSVVKRRCGCGESFSFSLEKTFADRIPNIPGVSVLSNEQRNTEPNAHTIIDFGTKDSLPTRIIVQKWHQLRYCGVFWAGSSTVLRFEVEEGATLDARFLAYAEDAHVSLDAESVIVGSNAHSHMQYRVFAKEKADISVQTHAVIESNISGATTHILGKNIFLGTHGKIRGIPKVTAKSDDIRASHSLSFEDIPEAESFFLESRGLSASETRALLLDSHLQSIFEGLDEGVRKVLKSAVNLGK